MTAPVKYSEKIFKEFLAEGHPGLAISYAEKFGKTVYFALGTSGVGVISSAESLGPKTVIGKVYFNGNLRDWTVTDLDTGLNTSKGEHSNKKKTLAAYHVALSRVTPEKFRAAVERNKPCDDFQGKARLRLLSGAVK